MLIAPDKPNSDNVDASRKILQVGRSEFITSALKKLPAELTLVSSGEPVETTLAGIREGMIVFVPSKVPSAHAYDRIGTWFEYIARNVSSNVQIALISSVICEVEESKEARYQAYRFAKLRLEECFSESFFGQAAIHRACIIRMGMFMQGSMFSRSRATWILASLLRPFASSDQKYHYTNRSILETSLSRIFQHGHSGTSRAAISVAGLGILQAPKFLSPALQKIYVANASDALNASRAYRA